MNDTARELGGALGVAVLGSLVASRFGSKMGGAIAGLDPDLRGQARSSLAGSLHVASGLPEAAGREFTTRAQDAFMSGFHIANAAAGLVALGGSVLVWRLLPQRKAVEVAEPLADELAAPTVG
jgi:hypothetical protein